MSLCEFIKNFNGIRFVVYKWQKGFLIFSLKLNRLGSKDQLGQNRDHTQTRPGRGPGFSVRGRPPHQSELCHDFLVTINFLPRPRVFLRSSKLFLGLSVNNSPSLSNFQLVVRNSHLDHKIMQLMRIIWEVGTKHVKNAAKLKI